MIKNLVKTLMILHGEGTLLILALLGIGLSKDELKSREFINNIKKEPGIAIAILLLWPYLLVSIATDHK